MRFTVIGLSVDADFEVSFAQATAISAGMAAGGNLQDPYEDIFLRVNDVTVLDNSPVGWGDVDAFKQRAQQVLANVFGARQVGFEVIATVK